MENTLAALSPQEFETLVEQAIDRRMEVWLTPMRKMKPRCDRNLPNQ